MTVHLAADAYVTVKKHVVGIYYTLEDEHHNEDYIVLDLYEILMPSLVRLGSESTSHESAYNIGTCK